jgi:hypothetical protein
MKRILLSSLAFTSSLFAESICDKTYYNVTPEIDKVVVACVDFAAIARMAPGFPLPPGRYQQTQLWVSPKYGRAVEGTASNGQYLVQPIRKAADGSLVVLLSFDGIDFDTLPILEVLVSPRDK